MLHSGTVPQRGGIRVPVNVREALAGGARRAGREFVSLSGDGRREEVIATATVPRRWA